MHQSPFPVDEIIQAEVEDSHAEERGSVELQNEKQQLDSSQSKQSLQQFDQDSEFSIHKT